MVPGAPTARRTQFSARASRLRSTVLGALLFACGPGISVDPPGAQQQDDGADRDAAPAHDSGATETWMDAGDAERAMPSGSPSQDLVPPLMTTAPVVTEVPSAEPPATATTPPAPSAPASSSADAGPAVSNVPGSCQTPPYLIENQSLNVERDQQDMARLDLSEHLKAYNYDELWASPSKPASRLDWIEVQVVLTTAMELEMALFWDVAPTNGRDSMRVAIVRREGNCPIIEVPFDVLFASVEQ